MYGVNKDSIHVEWNSPQDYHVDASYSFNKCNQGTKMIQGIRLPNMKRSRGVILTDYLSTPGMSSFLIISQKVKDVILLLKTPELEFIEMKVEANQDTLNYYGLHFESKMTDDFINWKESSFLIKKGYYGETVEKGIVLSSYDKYLKESRRISEESDRKLSLGKDTIMTNDISDKYDLFYSNIPFLGIFCSERFLEDIINNELTGFKVKRVV